MARLLRIAATIAFEAGAVAALHRMGKLPWLRIHWDDPAAWLASSSPEEALAAVVRLIALAIGWWLMATTAAYVLARLSGVPRLVHAVGSATAPAVRRLVDGAAAMGLTAAMLAGPVVPGPAADPAPVLIHVDDEGRPLPPGTIATQRDEDDNDGAGPAGHSAPRGPERVGWTPIPAGTGAVQPPVTPQRPAPAHTDSRYRVRPGDNLWTIAADQMVAAAGSNDVAASLVARYWRRVITANVARLESGDPDLIYPGERIVLPPVEEA
jgi:hypothetical protein